MSHGSPVRAWIDIENPPQAQYLAPFRDAFLRAGEDAVVTARDMGATFDLLTLESVPYVAVGTGYGASTPRKIAGVAVRTTQLVRHFRSSARPDLLVCAGRAALVAARLMRIPAFSIWDYEHADITFDRITHAFVVHPDVIPAAAFLERGIRADRLIPFEGLKEHISLGGVDLDATPAYAPPGVPDGVVRVLFRPPAEETHYHRAESGELASALLERLSRTDDAVVILAPRYPWQADEARRLPWRRPPVVLDRPIPFVSLLKGVDLVITSGGTMAREAAYLGVPSYSILLSEPGAVDLHLASRGRLVLVRTPEAFDTIRLERRGALDVLPGPRDVVDRLTDRLLQVTAASATRVSRVA